MPDTATALLSTITTYFGAIETREADLLDAVILRDLRPDSLDAVELIMAVEDQFSIEISDDEAMALGEAATIRDVLALVEAKLAGKAVAA